MSTPTPLTDDEATVLEIAGQQWAHIGAKETAIYERLRISPARYAARLNCLLDDPRALAHSPLVVRRLIRLRDQRRAARSPQRVRKEL